ncbi:MAG: RnfH family protein [Gammaproteobacteria bacterium]|jgi:putative ubiquitin-RnfH superfamily antitoxin RatB of RatAB toxin-antitoxin module|nr:RnfH family protein [Gammaproteobacteria bacterium]
MGNNPVDATIRVEVAYATPEKQVLLAVEVPSGCTAGEAIDLSGIRDEFPEMELNPRSIGIFSKKTSIEKVLEDGDRVEIYRPLIADPKEQRKQRARERRGK